MDDAEQEEEKGVCAETTSPQRQSKTYLGNVCFLKEQCMFWDRDSRRWSTMLNRPSGSYRKFSILDMEHTCVPAHLIFSMPMLVACLIGPGGRGYMGDYVFVILA